MATPNKVAAVKETTEDFKTSDAAVLTEYRGLTVAQIKELRVSLGSETKFAVVKNTLTQIAAKEAGVDVFDGQLSGPTAIAFIKGDPIAAAKSLTDFAKDHEALVIKQGYFEGKAMDAEEIKALAALESRELQLTRVASILKAPVAAAARVIDALRIKLEEGGSGADSSDTAAASDEAAPSEAPVEEAPAAEAAEAAEAPATEPAAETEEAPAAAEATEVADNTDAAPETPEV